MSRLRIPCVLALCLLPSMVLAQGKPANPGTPPMASAPPQMVVDSTGKVVGEVLKLESGGLSTVSLKYVLPDGDYVVMAAKSQSIDAFGTSVKPAMPPPPGGMPFAQLYFRESDCSGDAYYPFFNSQNQQLTRRQALKVSGLSFTAPEPPPPSSCPVPVGGDWLYATEALSCPLDMFRNPPITFLAYYGINSPNGCVSISGGLTVPTNGFPFAAFMVYRRIEDLAAKFKAPFYIP